MIECLTHVPGPALLFGLHLQIPSCQIHTYRRTVYVVSRARDRNIRPAFANCQYELHLMMKVTAHARIRHSLPRLNDRVCRLQKEEWLFATRIVSHLARMS